jgi:DNA-directed RNA polymerase subunit N (RpoN/RPB10)
MNSICYAIKKDGELCNTNLKEKNKHELKLEDKIYYVCGRHKKICNINDIDILKYQTMNEKHDNYEIEKDFKKRLNLNLEKNKVNQIDINEEIQYPITMPITCFHCNTVISRIDIFNKLWKIYIDNINNNMEYIDKILKNNNIDKSKWENKIKNNWWQKIGGFEEIGDGIELNFAISNNEWKDIGIENLCCRSMIYPHKETSLFVFGPSD